MHKITRNHSSQELCKQRNFRTKKLYKNTVKHVKFAVFAKLKDNFCQTLRAVTTGLDTCEPYEENGKVIIPAGGVVELNGVMFKISQQIELTMPNPLSMYWIAIGDNGNGTASAELVTRAGAWKPDKQGCYLPDGRRILNSVIQPKNSYVITPNVNDKVWEKPGSDSPGLGSDSVYLKKGWYLVALESGKGGKDATGSAGGVASQGISKKINRFLFIDENKYYDVYVGKGGTNGQNGGPIAGQGGGGSGGGEATIFDTLNTGYVIGGKGGNASNGDTGGAPGSNGFGNYGGMGGGFLGGGGGGGFDKSGGNGGVLSDTLNPGRCQIYKWFN